MSCECHAHHGCSSHPPKRSAPSWLITCAAMLALGLLTERLKLAYFPLFYVVGLYAGGLLGLLRQAWGRRPDIHSLMGLAVVAAVALGHWSEGVFLLLLFAAASELERRASQRSERALRELLDVRPAMARLVEGEVCREVRVEEVQVGDWIEIHAGELVSLDGCVRHGSALVDCSTLSGESLPIFVEPGASLLAGSKLLEGSLRLECQARAGDSTLARAGELIRSARKDKLRMQTSIERYTGIYSTLLPLVALGYGTISYLAGSLSAGQALYQSLSLLVVGSPCALVLACPAVYLTGLAQAARSGILIKGSRQLERLASIGEIAFDKTGTLTTGRFQLVGMIAPAGQDEDHWLAQVASLESRCQHPLGRSLVAAAEERGLALQPVENFWSLQGRGIQGNIGGVSWWIGRQLYLQEFSLDIPADLEAASREWQGGGETVVWAARRDAAGHTSVGCFRLADQTRAEASGAIKRLERMNIKTFLLTGDNQRAAARVAQELGLDQYRAELLPEDKVEAIRRAQPGIAMVGDGVNDAPALATATVGIAMGASGSELAIESSDVVLVHSELRRIPELLQLARRCRVLVLQNLTLAALTIVVLGAGVLTGHVGLAHGVLGHEGSSILVVLNGLRLLQTPGTRRWTLSPDSFGVLVSSLCLIHCLAIPFLIAALPALGWLAPDEKIHWLLTLIAVPVAIWALLPGFRVHRSRWIFLGGLGGVSLMLAAPFLLEGMSEEIAASVGATMLVSAHLFNRWRIRCHSGCCD